ncbi:hypothetical protein NMY22_g12849 [Coprinellus aureogranulatus]|nr:hypothetical protein NMY22_g12849 [Coprinellus aureogranulatus]
MSFKSFFTSSSATPTEVKKVPHATYFDHPNIPVLPTRLWTVGSDNKDHPDLRTAFTYQEVNADFWGYRYAEEMKAISEADGRVETVNRIRAKVNEYPDAPANLLEFLRGELEVAVRIKARLIASFEGDIENVKKALRDAKIALRYEDLILSL